jgi:putative ABC transport system permease protein
MLLHILIIFFRVLRRNKVHYSLVLSGLIVGFSSFLIMGSYVTGILHYDRYPNSDRIYRVSLSIETDGAKESIAYSDIYVGQRLKESVPEVEETVGIGRMMGSQAIELEDKVFFEADLIKAEPTYFSVFNHEWLQGSPDHALESPNAIVLTEELAGRIFGASDPLNKELLINDENYRVSGVIADLPSNTHFKFSGILSTRTSFIGYEVGFEDFCYTYIKLIDKAESKDVEKKLTHIYNEYVESAFAELNSKAEYHIEPLQDIHFGEEKLFDFPKYKKTNLFVFVGVAFLVLVLSAMNFINMSLSHYLTRGKEIGMKKILGLERNDVFSHLVFEGIVTTMIALVISIVIFLIVAPLLRVEFSIVLTMDGLVRDGVGIVLLLIAIIFPLLTALITTRRLRGSTVQSELTVFRYSQTRSYLMRSITVIQIACCSGLLICSVIVRNQFDLLLQKNPGYDAKNIVVIDIPVQFELGQVKAFSAILETGASILETTMVDDNSIPGGNVNVEIFELTTNEGKTNKIVECINVESNFLKILGLEIIEGRGFELSDDEFGSVAVVNEAMVKSSGWHDPLTEYVNYKYIDPDSKVRVIGVVKNFFLRGLNNPIQPLIIFLKPQQPLKVLAKLKHEFSSEINHEIDSVSSVLFSHPVLNKSLLDDDLRFQLSNEATLHRLLLVFSLSLALISVLGLYGATALSVARHLKQFAIRRIMGATGFSIFILACKTELTLIAIGVLISGPVSYLVMSEWLNNFSSKTTITWDDFLIPMLVIMGIGIMATSYNAVKGARSSAVDSINKD